MADFLAELIASFLGGLVPERVLNYVIGLLMLVAGLFFSVLAIYWVVASRATSFAIGLSLVLFGLAALSFRLMMKGFRSAQRHPPFSF